MSDNCDHPTSYAINPRQQRLFQKPPFLSFHRAVYRAKWTIPNEVINYWTNEAQLQDEPLLVLQRFEMILNYNFGLQINYLNVVQPLSAMTFNYILSSISVVFINHSPCCVNVRDEIKL